MLPEIQNVYTTFSQAQRTVINQSCSKISKRFWKIGQQMVKIEQKWFDVICCL